MTNINLSELTELSEERHLAHRSVVAGLWRRVRKAKSTRGGSRRTLYQQIRATGLSGFDLIHEILWDIVNTKDWLIFGEHLRDELHRSELKMKQALRAVEDVDRLLIYLLENEPQALEAMDERGWGDLNQRCSNRLEKKVWVFVDARSQHVRAKDALDRHRTISDLKAGAKQNELSRITHLLCNAFRQYSRDGHPHFGIVGQLLWETDVDTKKGTYVELSDRAKKREGAWRRGLKKGKKGVP